ncbi:MAG: zinc-binding dehydrogenase [Solirubrobacteraceae bacterium]|nr:zinc-binding dehydrogenase [Solirubrobacteraceae bacterium]
MIATTTARAIHYDDFGPPQVLKLVEIPKLEPARGQALVRVQACALNGYDLMARKGTYKPFEDFPHVLGGDISGIVEAYGPECAETAPVGAHVMLYHVIECGDCESCLRGSPTTCLKYGYLGAKYEGGYADYVVVPERNLIELPDDFDLVKAAAFPLGYSTAWHQLMVRGGLRAGEWVMIQAAGSGIGMAALQMAKLTGAHIIATAGSDEKCRKAIEMGAHHAINYNEQDLVQAVKGITGKRGVDVIFEHVGGELFEQLVQCVVRNGRIVTCGGVAGYQVTMNIAHVFHKQLSIIGSNSGTKWELLTMLPYLLDGRLDPVIDSVFPLAAAADAHAHLEERKAFGKVVLDASR